MIETIAKVRGLRAISKDSLDQWARLRILEATAHQHQGLWSNASPVTTGLVKAKAHFQAEGIPMEEDWFDRTNQKIYESYLRGVGSLRKRYRTVIKDQSDVEDVAAATMFEADPFGKIGISFSRDLTKATLAIARKYSTTQGVQRGSDYALSQVRDEVPGHSVPIGPGGLEDMGDSDDKGREVAAPGGHEMDPGDFFPALLQSRLGDTLRDWLMKLWNDKLTSSTREVAKAWLSNPSLTQRELTRETGTSQGSVMRFYNQALPGLLELAMKEFEKGHVPPEVKQISNLVERNERFLFASNKTLRLRKVVAMKHLLHEMVKHLRLQVLDQIRQG